MATNGGSDLVNQLLDDKVIKSGTSKPELIIIGAGIAGISAALEAKSKNIKFILIESNRAFSTVSNFPVKKPIFLKPEEVEVHSLLKLNGNTKESLLLNLNMQLNEMDLPIEYNNITHLSREKDLICAHSSERTFQAKAVILAIGKSGNHRRLNVPGENLDKVSNRLIDPKDYKHKSLIIVGGGDSAVEAAIACADVNAKVTLSYRGSEFTKVKSENLKKLKTLESHKKINIRINSNVKEIHLNRVEFDNGESIENESVLTLIGKELKYQFFQKSSIRLNHEWSRLHSISLILILLFFTSIYLWKKGQIFSALYCFNPSWKPSWLSIDAPFIYGAIYSTAVLTFGILRIKRKPTNYVKLQTITLILIQIIPLWILPTLLIPWMGHADLLPSWFKTQVLMVVQLLPNGIKLLATLWNCLAWPLFPFIWLDYRNCVLVNLWNITNFYNHSLVNLFYGKGAYCGWICSWCIS